MKTDFIKEGHAVLMDEKTGVILAIIICPVGADIENQVKEAIRDNYVLSADTEITIEFPDDTLSVLNEFESLYFIAAYEEDGENTEQELSLLKTFIY